MSDHTDRRLEIEIVHPQTRAPRWCLANVTVLSDDEGLPGAIVTLSDVTEIALLREELRQRATYDPLTGCLNRASTFSALQQVLSHDRPGSGGARDRSPSSNGGRRGQDRRRRIRHDLPRRLPGA